MTMSPDATVCGQAELLLVSLTAALPMQLALHAGCCGVSLMLRTAPSESRALSVGGGTSTDGRLALVDRCVMPHTDLPLAGVVLHDSLLDANLEADRVVLALPRSSSKDRPKTPFDSVSRSTTPSGPPTKQARSSRAGTATRVVSPSGWNSPLASRTKKR